jgi:hypothetical protein
MRQLAHMRNSSLLFLHEYDMTCKPFPQLWQKEPGSITLPGSLSAMGRGTEITTRPVPVLVQDQAVVTCPTGRGGPTAQPICHLRGGQ